LDPYGSPEEIGVFQLAWLGDSVWELHQRLRHVHFPLKSKELHLSVVNEVKAKSQSKSLSQIEHLLNANEIDLKMKDYEDAISQSSKQIDIKKLTEVISNDLLKEKLIIWLEENSEVKEKTTKTSKATKTSKTTKATKTAPKTTKTTKTTKTQNKKEKK